MINWIKNKWRRFKKWIILFFAASAIAAAPLLLPLLPDKIINEEYSVNGNRVVINETPSEPSVFRPKAKLEKWGGEVWLEVWLDEEGDDFAIKENGKTKWKTKDKKKEVHLYPLPPDDRMENGGFEYEIILKEKPKSNVIILKIKSQGLDFFYQPELTQEEIDRGNSRPENVVGSYAVYHSTQRGDYSKIGGKNYKSGKAFHIYRPQMEDSNGWKVWGELNIENGLMLVTIPQNFLDNAVYPVRHAAGATFGQTDTGSSEFLTGGDEVHGVKATFTGTTGSTADSISTRTNQNTDSSYCGAAIALVSNKTIITNGVTNAVNIGTGENWYTSSFSTSPTLTNGTEYWLLNGVNDYTQDIDYDSSGYGIGLSDTSNDGYHPISPTDGVLNSYEFSVYVTYTPAAPPPSTDEEWIKGMLILD